MEVVGPDGLLFVGTVVVEAPTVLAALQATGLDVRTVVYPGMGAYVAAVEGHEAEGAAGWVYEVRRGGEWRVGDRSAAFYALQPGDEVRWSWTA